MLLFRGREPSLSLPSPLVLLLSLALSPSNVAGITVQYPAAFSATAFTTTSLAPGATYTGLPAYDPTVLVPPAVPNPPPANSYDVAMRTTPPLGVSIPHDSLFFGFSIEMSVTNQLLAKNGSLLNVPFLNLCSNLIQRAGELHIRVGGNTQESAELVEHLEDGKFLAKDYSSVVGTTNTPPIMYTDELFYIMNNISSLLNVKWFLGIPFNDTNFRMGVVTHGHAILGDNLIGFQAANEPDFYPGRRRPESYSPADYFGEVGDLLGVMSDPAFDATRNLLIVPSTAQEWTTDSVWETGIVDVYHENIKYLAVERYPTDNCFATFGVGTERSAAEMFPQFMQHPHVANLVSQFFKDTLFAQEKGKPFVMFETNTASCGGFAGLSNSFGAALWTLDYGLQMAHGNFTQALLHFGGQSTYYNSFTAPPTNQSSFHEWTVGPTYYSMLVMAEVIGRTGTTRLIDMTNYDANHFAPVYGIYENDKPGRVAIINYLNDPNGANDFTAVIRIEGGAVPAEVKIKRLTADSITQLNGFTWAGQTFGGNFESDGRPMGEEQIETLSCDTSANVCRVTVPAPGFALVFLEDATLESSEPTATVTFATTVADRVKNTVTVEHAVLETSNGGRGDRRFLGSTSFGSQSGAGRAGVGRRVALCAAVLTLGFSLRLLL